MRTAYAFILGTIAGAIVVGFWGRMIADSVRDTTRGVRAKAAAGMRVVEEKTDEVLEHTKEHVSEALRAGRHAIRP